MNLSEISLSKGQRYQYHGYGNNFVAEILEVFPDGFAEIILIQIQNWPGGHIGMIYPVEDLRRSVYTYLPNQDKPTAQ